MRGAWRASTVFDALGGACNVHWRPDPPTTSRKWAAPPPHHGPAAAIEATANVASHHPGPSPYDTTEAIDHTPLSRCRRRSRGSRCRNCTAACRAASREQPRSSFSVPSDMPNHPISRAAGDDARDHGPNRSLHVSVQRTWKRGAVCMQPIGTQYHALSPYLCRSAGVRTCPSHMMRHAAPPVL